MMRAAYKYYQYTTNTSGVTNKITLGEINSGSASKIRVRTKPARKAKIEFTPEEMALLNLINSGQVGSLIARHAPVGDE